MILVTLTCDDDLRSKAAFLSIIRLVRTVWSEAMSYRYIKLTMDWIWRLIGSWPFWFDVRPNGFCVTWTEVFTLPVLGLQADWIEFHQSLLTMFKLVLLRSWHRRSPVWLINWIKTHCLTIRVPCCYFGVILAFGCCFILQLWVGLTFCPFLQLLDWNLF